MISRLKEIFDNIEIYDPKQNVGLRSLKNIGVWLSVYALTETSDQDKVVHELAEKSGGNVDEIKSLATALSTPASLKQIIEDYESTNGTFTLSVKNHSAKENIENKIKECNLDFLLPHIKVDEKQDTELLFIMKNEIKYLWAKANKEIPLSYQLSSALFDNKKTDFLEANSDDHALEYGLIEYNNHLFHVVNLSALQDGKRYKVDTNMYIIEPVDKKDAIYLQVDYINIIEKANHELNDENTYRLFKKHYQRMPSLKVEVSKDGELIMSDTPPQGFGYDYTVRFPELSEALKTSEQRLGVYAGFAGKTIANMLIDTIKYQGERELIYDQKGGEIKNLEKAGAEQQSGSRKGAKRVRMDYTVSNAFMMVYGGEKGADYYPYFIADPKVNLKLSFAADEKYPLNAAGKNLINDIHNKLIAEYQNEYKLDEYNDFFDYYEKKGQAHQLSPSTHDFFEHCMINAAGSLPALHEINENMKLQFADIPNDRTHRAVSHHWMFMLLGLPDGEAKKANATSVTINTYALKCEKLKNLHSKLIENLNYGRGNPYKFAKIKDIQYSVLLGKEEAIKTFITNPIFTAQYLIEHADECTNGLGVTIACQILINEINQFRHLRNGISDEAINLLEVKLNNASIIQKMANVHNVSNIEDPEETRISRVIMKSIYGVSKAGAPSFWKNEQNALQPVENKSNQREFKS